MSLVVLVMSEAVENLANSEFEKFSTFSKTSLLRALAEAAAIFDAIKATIIVHSALSRVTRTIVKPVRRT